MLVVTAVVAVVAGGCAGGVETLSFPAPPAVSGPPSTAPPSLPPGLASVAETPVPGVSTTTAPAVGPGGSSLNGTVTGPTGPVAGATVEIDRFVGTAFASVRTTTAADGTWSFRNILGGDYRVRAWSAPNLDMATPELVFLASGQPQSVDLQLAAFPSPQVQVAVNPANPVANQPVNLVVQVTNPTVNADGVVTAPPVTGTQVALVAGPDWQVNNANPLTTDATGQVTFEVECTNPGLDPLSAQVGNGPPVALQMPACGSPPPTTTTSSTTSTTQPGGSVPTSTTCPPPTTTPGETTTSLSYGGQC